MYYSDSPVAGVVWSAVAGVVSAALKALNPTVAAVSTAVSVLNFAIQLAAADLKESEMKAFEKMKSYCENELTEIKDDDVDIYVYLLDGGYSTEMKIRAVKKSTGETLSEEGFDLKQYKPYSVIWNSLEEYGKLVSVNRRFWQYSYVER